MSRLSVRAASIAALLALTPQAAAQAPANPAASHGTLPETARAAAAAVDSFHAALRRNDPAAALALVADDALVFEEGRAERSKAEYALRHAAADAAFSKAVPSVRSRRTGHAAGDLAWIASESRNKGRFKGQDVDRIMVETMVLRRDSGGAWKIVHIHWSSAQPSTE
jgi:ketosteroid isomerase-like protein